MKKILLNKFKEYETMKKDEIKKNIGNFSPTILLPLIYKENLNFEKIDSIKKVNINEDNSNEISDEILRELKINKNNINPLKFIFHELIANIYDHSQFKNAYVMGKMTMNIMNFLF